MVSASILRQAASAKMDRQSQTELMSLIEATEYIVDALAFCLSAEGDLLSQWRGYAADATGVSIGFSKSSLEDLTTPSEGTSASSIQLARVEYEPSAQDELIKPIFSRFRDFVAHREPSQPDWRTAVESGSLPAIKKAVGDVQTQLRPLLQAQLELMTKLYLLKSAAFSEEREWRLLSILFKPNTHHEDFRVAGHQIIPYRAYPLHGLTHPPINEIILGPKHKTPLSVVQDFLAKYGHTKVRVSQSAATYR